MLNNEIMLAGMKYSAYHPSRFGFTLIELSIVLVIIGLIVGGILVGRDLIQAAEIRKAISQVGSFNASANTFISKYNCIPGDCATATNFFAGSINGDGNGVIDSNWADAQRSALYFATSESFTWYNHLAAANLINLSAFDQSNVSNNKEGLGYNALIRSPANAIFPLSYNGMNYLRLGGQGVGSLMYLASSLSAQEAFQLDTKLDDGLPETGTVINMSVLNGAALGSNQWYSTSTCHNSSGYFVTLTSTDNNCGLMIRASF